MVGLGEDDFCSLTDQQIETYLSKYDQPYLYIQMGKGIAEIPLHVIEPNLKDKTGDVVKKESDLKIGGR